MQSLRCVDLDCLHMPNDIQTKQLAACCSVQVRNPHQNPDLLIIQVLEHSLLTLQRVANQQGLLVTYLPSYRHTWLQLGVCTYKQLAMAAYWSGSAMLTASQDRHKLLMNDIHSRSLAMTTQLDCRCLEANREVNLSSSEL